MLVYCSCRELCGHIRTSCPPCSISTIWTLEILEEFRVHKGVAALRTFEVRFEHCPRWDWSARVNLCIGFEGSVFHCVSSALTPSTSSGMKEGEKESQILPSEASNSRELARYWQHQSLGGIITCGAAKTGGATVWSVVSTGQSQVGADLLRVPGVGTDAQRFSTWGGVERSGTSSPNHLSPPFPCTSPYRLHPNRSSQCRLLRGLRHT
jgi:hypothetical protein